MTLGCMLALSEMNSNVVFRRPSNSNTWKRILYVGEVCKVYDRINNSVSIPIGPDDDPSHADPTSPLRDRLLQEDFRIPATLTSRKKFHIKSLPVVMTFDNTKSTSYMVVLRCMAYMFYHVLLNTSTPKVGPD